MNYFKYMTQTKLTIIFFYYHEGANATNLSLILSKLNLINLVSSFFFYKYCSALCEYYKKIYQGLCCPWLLDLQFNSNLHHHQNLRFCPYSLIYLNIYIYDAIKYNPWE